MRVLITRFRAVPKKENFAECKRLWVSGIETDPKGRAKM